MAGVRWTRCWSTADPLAAPVLARLSPHKDTSTVTFADLDGRPVLLTAGDTRVRVWDPVDGQPLGRALTGHTDWVAALHVGQVEGRPAAVSGSLNRTARIWDLTSRRSIGQPLAGHRDCVHAVTLTERAGRPAWTAPCGCGT